MKSFILKTCAALTLAAMSLGPVTAFADTTEDRVHLGLLPPTLQDFEHLQKAATTPERGATMLVLAMLVFENYPDEAEKMVVAAITDNNLVIAQDGTRTLMPHMKDHLHKRLVQDPNIARSYVEGATPQNRYTMPEGQGYTFRFSRNRLSQVSDTEVRVFIATSGQSSPRPVFMKKQENGLWKAEESSSLFVGVYLPAN
jgi:hypothetical protein